MIAMVNRISICLVVIIFSISSLACSDKNKNNEVANEFMDSYVRIYGNSKGEDRERRISDLKIQYADKIDKLPGDIQADITTWQIDYSGCYKCSIEMGNPLCEYFCTKAQEIRRIYGSDNPANIRKAIELKEKALALYKNGKYTDCQQALQYYNDAISFDLNNAELYSNRAIVYSTLNKNQKAIEDLSKAIDLNIFNYQNYLLRGHQYLTIQKYTKALEDIEKAITLDPKKTEVYIYRGTIYIALKEIDKACDDARKACELGDCSLLDYLRKKDICS